MILFLMVLVAGYLCSVADPTDPLVYYQRLCNDKTLVLVRKTMNNNCSSCEVAVNKYSYHCSRCNRCSHMLDHHCEWLNNCIGYNNYNLFVYATSLLILYMLFNVAWAISFFVMHPGRYKELAFLAINCLINLIIIGTAVQLLGMHVYLKINKLTTFSYVTFRRANKR